jgi:hypothetical protein
VVGLYDRSLEPGRFLAIDRGTGDVRWSIAPDLDHLRESFGADALAGGTMIYSRHVVCDLFGTGDPVTVVQFQHSLWYPVALVFVTCAGEVLGQYDSWGHISDLVVADLDDDGREEVIAAGTNNAKAFNGATIFVLDHEHRSGATVDPQTRSETSHRDGSRVRVVLPAFPPAYQQRMQDERLRAYLLRVLRSGTGEVYLSAQIGDTRPIRFLTVSFDADLRPLASDISDALKLEITHTWPDSLKLDTGPADPGWRAAWLDRHVRYVAGERQ